MDLSYGRYQKHRKSEIPRPCEKLFQPVFQPLIQVPSTDQRNCPRWSGEAITRGKLVILGVLLTLFAIIRSMPPGHSNTRPLHLLC